MTGLLLDRYEIETASPSDLKNVEICKTVLEELDRHYPGHPWMCYADYQAGYLAIKLNYVQASGRLPNEGMLMHLSTLGTAGAMKTIMRYGGELLERFSVTRGGFKPEDRFIALDHGLDTSGVGA